MKKSRKRERDEEEPEEMKEIKEMRIKKRKRSFSGIELTQIDDDTVKSTPPQTDLNEADDEFKQFGIDASIAVKLKEKSIVSLFEVQKKVYMPIYEGKSTIVTALTGSGKTLSFVLPIIQKCKDKELFKQDKPIVMVMTPTRELSVQVGREFSDLSNDKFKFQVCLIYGGVSMEDQVFKLRGGCDIIVGTPGRIMDMIERGNLKLEKIKIVVLDEADKMLSMGFEEQIEDIFKKIFDQKESKKIQVCLFSATIDQSTREVARKIIKDQDEVFIDLVKDLSNKTPKTVTHLGVNCLKNEKTTTIADLILCYGGRNKATIVFVNTKRECNELMISEKIKQEVQIIHGDINQAQREATLEAFRKGKIKCLVATDVASRGLDIPIVDLIIQSEPPKELDTYIHRAGRTARAGRSGTCITLYSKFTENLLSRIEQRAKIKIKRIGAPQKNEIIEASIRDTKTSLLSIDDSMIKLFTTDAKKLIEEFGAENTVARLLAYVSGHTEKMKSRSLLCGAEGWITYSLNFQNTFHHAGYIWNFFKKILREEIKNKIRGLRCFASMDGCVYDFPEDGHELFEEIIYNDRFYGTNYTLSKPEILPELQGTNEANSRTSTFSSNGTHFGRERDRYRQGTTTNEQRSRSMSHRPGKIDIFVGNMPYNADESLFRNWIESHGIDGKDFEVRMVIDKETNKPKGFGFLSVYSKRLFDDVIALNGKEFNRRSLVITETKGK